MVTANTNWRIKLFMMKVCEQSSNKINGYIYNRPIYMYIVYLYLCESLLFLIDTYNSACSIHVTCRAIKDKFIIIQFSFIYIDTYISKSIYLKCTYLWIQGTWNTLTQELFLPWQAWKVLLNSKLPAQIGTNWTLNLWKSQCPYNEKHSIVNGVLILVALNNSMLHAREQQTKKRTSW